MSKPFEVVEESSTCARISFGEREIILVGTAHVSAESAEEVRQVIERESPGRVCVEIDEGRYQALSDPKSWEKMDIHKVLKEKKGFLLLANLALASFQRRIGESMGSRPGEEMRQAFLTAEEMGIPCSFSDRPVQVTLQRAWRKSNLWNKMKLLSVLMSSVFSREEIDPVELEKLKRNNVVQNMMEELAGFLPSVKEVLIDERDQYLATQIFQTQEPKVVAVVGAGHAAGMIEWLRALHSGEEEADLEEISRIPERTLFSKVAPWLVPLLVLSIIGTGFFIKGFEGGMQMVLVWILANGVLAAVGAIIALAHPLTVVVAFLAAPLTSMNPLLGVGLVAAMVEYFLRKPRIEDLERLQDDAHAFKGWYKNRVTRILLVLLFSSLGSSLGTFIAIPRLTFILGG